MSDFPPKRRTHIEETMKIETCNHFVISESVFANSLKEGCKAMGVIDVFISLSRFI